MGKWVGTVALACAMLSLAPVFAHSLAALHTPKTGSAERTALMDAMRPVIGKGQRKRIVFVTRRLQVKNGWAYFTGFAQDTYGKPVGPAAVGGNLAVLLHYVKGTWQVKYFVYHGDVIEPEFMRRYPEAPRAIFGN